MRLNTPGVADGGFELQVNGKMALVVNGVYYREAMQSASIMSYLPTTLAPKMKARASSLTSRANVHRRWSFGYPGPLFDAQAPALSAEDVGASPSPSPRNRIVNVLNARPKGSSVIGFEGIFFR